MSLATLSLFCRFVWCCFGAITYGNNKLYGQILAFAGGFIISVYHSGIERDLWEGFSACSESLSGISGDEFAKLEIHLL